MADKYYQKYGPISRRRADGTLKPNNTRDDPRVDPEEIEPLPLERPSRRRPMRRSHSRGLWTLLFLVVIGVGGFLLLPYALNAFANDRAAEGISLQGQPIAGMNQTQIRALLDQRYSTFRRTPVTITFEGKTWTPTLEQLGVRFDLDRATNDALNAGHSGGPLTRIRELWQIWQGGLDVAPRLSVDVGKLQTYITSISNPLELPPRDAALSIADGKVFPTSAQIGRQVLADATIIDILHALQTLQPQTVALRTRTLSPLLTDDAIKPAIADAHALLSTPLTLRRDTQSWTWGPEKIAELLTIKTEQGHMSVNIDPDRLTQAVESLAQVVDSGTAEPRVAFNKGRPKIIQQGQNGWRMQQAEAVQVISQTLHLPMRDIALPVEELTPQVTAKNLANLGIVELIGEGKSSFAGSAAYRITNIKAGAARMNGVLIPPDSEFSFNTQLGAVDESNGFVEGYAVIGQRTQLEWGGGVCQDSTTVYRAAFWAGLPITERHAHPFYISWYDDYSFPDQSAPGMDATIYTGVQDFKFVNDTGHWLLMEAVADTETQVLTVRLYGTKPNRTVSIKGPEIDNIVPPPAEPVIITDSSVPAGTSKQTDTARKGMDITVYRIITENGAQKPPEAFFTRFKAWPNVFVRGTG